MNRELKKSKWTVRQCQCEWEPIGKPFSISRYLEMEASEAAEYAACELDFKEFDEDFDMWMVGNFNNTVHYIEVQYAPEGPWRRFTVRVKE